MPQSSYQLVYGQRNVLQTVEYAFVNGSQFEFWDLLETVREVRAGGTRVTNRKMFEALIAIGVLKTPGSRYIGAWYNEDEIDELIARLEEREALLLEQG